MSAVAPDVAPAPAAAAGRGGYIAGPVYDWCFFLGPPLASLVLGAFIAGTRFSEERFVLWGQETTGEGLAIGVLIHAHLVAVVFRSHLNGRIFKRHPVRFMLVPVALYAAMMVSDWALVTGTVLVVLWDVYHSGLQTFGLGRIYDRNQGNDARVGRRLDVLLNHLLYAGPILGGVTMREHVRVFSLYEEVGGERLSEVPRWMRLHQGYFTWAFLVGGTLFVLAYVLWYVRLSRRGYRVSFQKVFLLSSTGLCSVYTWGWNRFGVAFFIMNLFHAVQYLGLVWWAEGGSWTKRLRLSGRRYGKAGAMVVGLSLVLGYGLWSETQPDDVRWSLAVVQVVALMHFWYDGFIWSVGKKEI